MSAAAPEPREERDVCGICHGRLDPFSAAEGGVVTPDCGAPDHAPHLFHGQCLTIWAVSFCVPGTAKCPLCNRHFGLRYRKLVVAHKRLPRASTFARARDRAAAVPAAADSEPATAAAADADVGDNMVEVEPPAGHDGAPAEAPAEPRQLYSNQELTDFLNKCLREGWIPEDGLAGDDLANWIESDPEFRGKFLALPSERKNQLGRVIKTAFEGKLVLQKKRGSKRRYVCLA
jgi:hypothetical protein